MNKMETPDKIYVHIGPYLGLLNTTIAKTNAPGEQEYIRKGALVEWLENKIKLPDVSFIKGLTYLAYRDVVEHLNSM